MQNITVNKNKFTWDGFSKAPPPKVTYNPSGESFHLNS
jgi:hypothetical protein